MICKNCGQEFEGKFCPNCGAPAPKKVICPSCRTEFEGNFCPECGACSTEYYIERCTNIYDVNGNKIDVERIAGLYLSVKEIKAFLARATDYPLEEIDEIATYIYENIDGYDYGALNSIIEKRKLEAEVRPYSPPPTSGPYVSDVAYAPRYEPVSSSYIPPVTQKVVVEYQGPKPAKPMSKHARIKENKRNAVACCPKCGSTSISANKKGFGIGKAVVGAWAAGPVGLVAGNLGAKKVWVTCLNCGHRWKM